MINPETPFDSQFPRCKAHRSTPAGEIPTDCPNCIEAARWVESRATVAAVAAATALRDCEMCDAEGKRWDRTHIPLSPALTCDHATAHDAVLAALDEREAEQDAARARFAEARARAVAEAVRSTPAGRAAARALVQAACRPVIPVQRGRREFVAS